MGGTCQKEPSPVAETCQEEPSPVAETCQEEPSPVAQIGGIMTRKEEAVAIFTDHFHCSQAVLAAYADECGITKEQALKLGGCLGSGMRRGEVCGACTGALMVLGLLFGQSDKEDLTSRRRSDEVNDRMMDLFAQKSGSYLCREIIGYDISTEEAKKYAREHHLYANCHEMVGNAVDALEEILQKNN